MPCGGKPAGPFQTVREVDCVRVGEVVDLPA